MTTPLRIATSEKSIAAGVSGYDWGISIPLPEKYRNVSSIRCFVMGMFTAINWSDATHDVTYGYYYSNVRDE